MSMGCSCGGIPPYMSDLLIKHYDKRQTAFWNKEDFSERQRKSNKIVETMERPEKPLFYETNDLEVWCLEKNGLAACDKVSKECIENMEIVNSFLSEKFGRHFASTNKKMVACIRDAHAFNQVYWNPIMERVYFGEADPKVFNCFYTNLDMTAHEFMHGVIQYNSNLPYYGQSGALNESLADIYMIMIKQFKNKTDANAPDANWTFGDGILVNAAAGDAIRSLKDPGNAYKGHPELKDDPQVFHMNNYIDTCEDRGGIHYNCGIPNHAFYLAATKIGGQSWEKTGKIWDLAMTQAQGDDFSNFAQRTIQIAQEHFKGQVANLVGQAWERVGVDLRGPISNNGVKFRNTEEQRAFYRQEQNFCRRNAISVASIIAISALSYFYFNQK